MLKTIENIKFTANLEETKGEICGNSMVGDNSMVGSGEIINPESSIKRKNQVEKAKSKNLIKPKNHDFSFNSRNLETGPGFLISEARIAFT